MTPSESALDSFLERHANVLDAIVRYSRGAICSEDVRNEAWLQAFDLGQETGRTLDLASPTDAAALLRRIRLHFERAQRSARATRSLDEPLGDGPDCATLLDFLVAGDGEHPLLLMERAEAPCEPEPPPPPEPCHSELAAWHWLVLRFDRRMVDLAAYLLISTSWCRQRRRRARRRASAQWPLAQRLPSDAQAQADALQPWRRFKLPARQATAEMQLTLDYWRRPAQPASGQLWLL